MVGYACAAGGRQRSCMVGELRGAEARQQTEGVIEDSDQNAGEGADPIGGDAEVGDEPQGSGFQVRGEVADEAVEFCLREAVEEEVGDDEVIGLGRDKGESRGVVGLNAAPIGGAVRCQQVQHGSTCVDCFGLESRIRCEEFG